MTEDCTEAKRHRRRARKAGATQDFRQQVVTLQGTLVPSTPVMQRPGLDPEVIVAIQGVDDLIKDMRNGVLYPSAPENEDDAVKRYLLYISMLVDIVLPDIVMSAIAGHDHMVEMKQRILLEYAAKARYFNDHPDYALYMMTINDAEQVLKKLTLGKSDRAAIARQTKHVEDMKARFPGVAGIKKAKFDDIFAEYAEKDDYVWLYGAPSALLHGDPEGMHVVIEQRPDGTQVPRQMIPLEQVNAMLVDTGRNALLFCDKFIARFHVEDDPLTGRVRTLHRTFHELLLKHNIGRDGDAIEAVTREIAEMDGGGPPD